MSFVFTASDSKTGGHGRPHQPVYRMQRGSNMPLNLTSCPNIAQQSVLPNPWQKPFSLPVATSSTISIQLLGQEPEPRPFQHITNIPTTPTKGTATPPAVGTPPLKPRALHIPLRVNNRVGSTSSGGSNSTPSTPTTPGTPTSPIRRYKDGVLVTGKPTASVPPLRRPNSGPPSPGSVMEELKCKLSPRGSETDQDSVIQSSLDDSHDSRSLTSYSTHSSGGGEHDSACSVEGEVANCERVAVASESDTAVVVQLTCDCENNLDNTKVVDLLVQAANACLQYYQRSESDKGAMNSTQIEKLVLGDRRPVKEHVDEISRELSDNVVVVKAAARKLTDKTFVGTFVNEPVLTKQRVTVGKSAVIVSLQRLNRIAPAREFSDQLCHHIISHRPEGMGKPSRPQPERVSRKEKAAQVNNSRQLMAQNFLYDPTISVTEAARRSFVEIKDFVHYG